MVPKREAADGTRRYRLVIDYSALNEITMPDRYPLPNITDILNQLGGSKYFSTFDLASEFHQVSIHPDDVPKTAFSTPFGHYEFKRLLFGLRNAPQRLNAL